MVFKGPTLLLKAFIHILEWECGLHVVMLTECLQNGDEFPLQFRDWDDDLVQTADRRYANIINGPRVNEVPLYVPPSKYERAQGLGARASEDATRIRSEAVAAGGIALSDSFYLLRCKPELMSSREHLIGRHVAVNWEGAGTWFIGWCSRSSTSPLSSVGW